MSLDSLTRHLSAWCVAALMAAAPLPARAQDQTGVPPAADDADQTVSPAPPEQEMFRLGEIVHVPGRDPDRPGIGGALITHQQMSTFDRTTVDQAVNLVPGVTGTFDANGRRNERDVFVRGFGRQQVPLFVDGVRVYLPADNRLGFARFLTADLAGIQIQKGYASVLDGPGAMGGAINLVTRTPVRAFEAEGGVSGGGRAFEGWTRTSWPDHGGSGTTCRAAWHPPTATPGRSRARISPPQARRRGLAPASVPTRATGA